MTNRADELLRRSIRITDEGDDGMQLVIVLPSGKSAWMGCYEPDSIAANVLLSLSAYLNEKPHDEAARKLYAEHTANGVYPAWSELEKSAKDQYRRAASPPHAAACVAYPAETCERPDLCKRHNGCLRVTRPHAAAEEFNDYGEGRRSSEPPERCQHGVRWEHPCRACDNPNRGPSRDAAAEPERDALQKLSAHEHKQLEFYRNATVAAEPEKPVAWMYTSNGVPCATTDRWPRPLGGGWTETPLYASPSAQPIAREPTK